MIITVIKSLVAILAIALGLICAAAAGAAAHDGDVLLAVGNIALVAINPLTIWTVSRIG